MTVLVTICADGTSQPALVIGKGKDLGKPRWAASVADIVRGTMFQKAVYINQENSYMTNEIFRKWFEEVYLPATEEQRKKGIKLLVLDNFSAHVELDFLLELARRNNVYVVGLPPHSTHMLQPLDVLIMQALKAYYSTSLSLWQLQGNNAYRTMSTEDFLNVICRYHGELTVPVADQVGAWDKALTPTRIKQQASTLCAKQRSSGITMPRLISMWLMRAGRPVWIPTRMAQAAAAAAAMILMWAVGEGGWPGHWVGAQLNCLKTLVGQLWGGSAAGLGAEAATARMVATAQEAAAASGRGRGRGRGRGGGTRQSADDSSDEEGGEDEGSAAAVAEATLDAAESSDMGSDASASASAGAGEADDVAVETSDDEPSGGSGGGSGAQVGAGMGAVGEGTAAAGGRRRVPRRRWSE